MKTLIRLLLQKQSDLGLHCFSWPFSRQLAFEILKHLPFTFACSYFTALFMQHCCKNVGIIHLFKHLQCQVPRKLFEQKAAGQENIKHLLKDLASVNVMKKYMCDHFSCIFHLIPNQITLKMLLNIQISFSLHWISLNKMVSACKVS